MPMYWTFNCFLGCWYISSSDFQILNFDVRKKEDQVARIGVRGGGLGDSGNARKKTFFFHWCLPLKPLVGSCRIHRRWDKYFYLQWSVPSWWQYFTIPLSHFVWQKVFNILYNEPIFGLSQNAPQHAKVKIITRSQIYLWVGVWLCLWCFLWFLWK